jgi:tetratricopeptide (TPR) repeat protein
MLHRTFAHASVPIRTLLLVAIAVSILVCATAAAQAQVETIDDNSADPMKLFERGQNAHARGDFEGAIEYYDEALKIRPEFPEAEFQKGNALVSLKKLSEAESAFRRASELRANWSLPQVNLGVLLARLNRNDEAQTYLRHALQLENKNQLALRTLAELRLRAGDAREALDLSQRATTNDTSAAAWIVRAMAERKLGLLTEAASSLDHVLRLEPNNVMALLERAELHVDKGNFSDAINDLRTASQIAPADKGIASRLADALQRNGQADEARKVAKSAGLVSEEQPGADESKVVGTTEEIEAANSSDVAVARKALATLVEKNPCSAMLLARLGASYRTDDPTRSLDFYRRASELRPENADYAVGYASALVQQKRFPEAVLILRGVIRIEPDNYTAHANLATALYAQKSFAEALIEYDWIVRNKPDLAIAYYFIATAHDKLGQYQEALAAYEIFMARADAQTNQLEIDKVKLRLPKLRRQIQLGQGVKRKPTEE